MRLWDSFTGFNGRCLNLEHNKAFKIQFRKSVKKYCRTVTTNNDLCSPFGTASIYKYVYWFTKSLWSLFSRNGAYFELKILNIIYIIYFLNWLIWQIQLFILVFDPPSDFSLSSQISLTAKHVNPHTTHQLPAYSINHLFLWNFPDWCHKLTSKTGRSASSIPRVTKKSEYLTNQMHLFKRHVYELFVIFIVLQLMYYLGTSRILIGRLIY